MILISNKGNTVGPSVYQNQPLYIEKTLKEGFKVKTDLWVFPKTLMIGDTPLYPVTFDLLSQCLVEARNLNAVEFLVRSNLDGFYRGGSDIVFTTKGAILSFKSWIREAIIMNPEDHTFDILANSTGICSDYIKGFINENSSAS